MQEVTQGLMNTKGTPSEFAAELQGWAEHFKNHGKRIVAVLPPVEINSQGLGAYFFLAEPIK